MDSGIDHLRLDFKEIITDGLKDICAGKDTYPNVVILVKNYQIKCKIVYYIDDGLSSQ